ncbi:hypothetical protein H6P81_011215 [Aristolochia fimbriata]|uniref:Uncharacterized protein n=1 Tax=Aristolochia fimbriata TaxID=158543 RepID=A0AAV7EQW0_ARIFI|nr:hypothetical protein H6P81_011215 [Aristolochia fimbriata]
MAAEAETARKRFREEEADSGTETKRQCSSSLNNILSLLESEEEEPTEDLSNILTTLEQELSTSSSSPSSSEPGVESLAEPALETAEVAQAEKGGEGEVVMKHLLEASDDELGIPSWENGEGVEARGESRGVGEFLGYDGFWEFEDEAANYYTLLQSELFMS